MLRPDLCCPRLTGPAPGCCPLPAQQAQQEALDLISDWSQQEMDYLREEVGLRFGLKIGSMLHCAVGLQIVFLLGHDVLTSTTCSQIGIVWTARLD